MSQSVIQNPKSKILNPLWGMVGILFLAAAFRFLAVDSAPPGWRDDELIEYDMDRRIADGWRPLFITEAEGHEPVYHYLHAGTILLFGDNIVGYKWLPLAFGLISIALTYALAKKMFGVKVALLAAALSGTLAAFLPTRGLLITIGLWSTFGLSMLPLLIKIARRDPPVLIVAPIMIFVRALALGLGMFGGALRFYIFRRDLSPA